MPVTKTESSISIGRFVMPVLVLLMPSAQTPLLAQEKPVVALSDFVSAEVRQQGFTLPKAMQIHVYARGGGSEHGWGDQRTLFAYGWILNASTREVVWQMKGENSHREGGYRIADQYLELPAGSYEAYFSNHAFGRDTFFTQWSRNIDRRKLNARRGSEDSHGFLAFFGADSVSQLRVWRKRAENYGMQIALPTAEAALVQTFQAPLRWKNIVASLTDTSDNGQWDQGFRVKKPVTMHVYAIGEGTRGSGMNDSGWILNAHTRERVWEMSADKAQYAGGAEKNLRQVETIHLPPGEYIASFATDDSHSPSDWNAAPPCDPGLYGLTLAVPNDAEAAQVVPMPIKAPGPILAEVLRVKDEEDRSASFTLAHDQAVRVYAIGEGVRNQMADWAWIEEARSGKTVWTMEFPRTHPAGGALKNRMIDERLSLPRGTYILHVKTDDTHAYGDWNSAPPRDAEHYGATVYSAVE
jgi:hypothetical protein